MRRYNELIPEFVMEIPLPNEMKDGILYVDAKHKVAAHFCPCGCKNEVITPLSKEYGWTLTYTGDDISLYPSVGNGALECKSHYFIRENHVLWCRKIDQAENGAYKRNDSSGKRNEQKQRKKRKSWRYFLQLWHQ